jgi:hypothetical protein
MRLEIIGSNFTVNIVIANINLYKEESIDLVVA